MTTPNTLGAAVLLNLDLKAGLRLKLVAAKIATGDEAGAFRSSLVNGEYVLHTAAGLHRPRLRRKKTERR